MPLDINFTQYAEAITWIDEDRLLIGNEDSEWFTVELANIPAYDGQSNHVEGINQMRDFARSRLQ